MQVIHTRFHQRPIQPSQFIDQEIVTTEFKTVVKPNLRRVTQAMNMAQKVAGGVGTANPVVTVAFLNQYYGITSNAGNSVSLTR